MTRCSSTQPLARSILSAALWTMTLGLASAAFSADAAEADGGRIFKERCASCHENMTAERMPTREALREYAPEHLIGVMTTGIMQEQSRGLNADEIRAVAQFLSAKPFGDMQAAVPQPNLCTGKPGALTLDGPQWNGWGRDPENTRLQPQPGLTASDIPRLKVKWVYAYPGRMTYGQPTLVADRVFIGSPIGKISSLDATSGCAYWIYDAEAGVKTAISIGKLSASGPIAAFFGDEKGSVYAVNAETGQQIWKIRAEEHSATRITGAPKLHEGRLYVPVSSYEEGLSTKPDYPCCTFRGSVVALDASTGQTLWKSYTIAEAAKPLKKSTAGTQLYGPAGVSVWNSPTIDVKRGVLYVGTGNSYTDVPTDSHDSVLAIDLKSGARKWTKQMTPKDSFVVGCFNEASRGKNNCPEEIGPDYDFGASIILKQLPNGKQLLLAGQKSGVVYGMDPDDSGKILWETKVGAGGALGGIEWGMAADDEHVYAAVSDIVARNPEPGLSALKLATGEKVWHVPTPAPKCSWKGGRCARAQSAAVTAIPGAVFSGAFDGYIRAYSAKDGSVLWEFDTGRPFTAVNGVTVSGGNIDGGGATIVNGRVFVNSGYGSWGGGSGRLLLVFTVDGK